MKAIYNSRTIDQGDIQISTNNRAFCYGDGLFETIVTGPSRINLIQSHMGRLKKHCQILHIDFPNALEENIDGWVNELTNLNKLTGDVRTKINLWRKEGGLYEPKGNGADFLITVKPTDQAIYRNANTIGIAGSIYNQYSPISELKSANSLNYVLAGIEKANRTLDEIILLDGNGHLSETHIGNLFWTNKGQIFTPSLETGCIAGIMRQFILETIQVKVVKAEASELLKADSIFSTNASGIQFYKALETSKTKLVDPAEHLSQIIKRIQQP